MMHIHRMIRLISTVLVGVLAYAVSCHAVAQASLGACQALVRFKNDLWFARSDGSMVAQLTKDGAVKPAVAMSPDGSMIAYSGKAPPADVSLIGSSGAALMDVNLQAQDAIVGLKWTSSNMLVASEHVSPTSARSYFLNVPTSPFTTSVSVLSSGQLGGNCAMSRNGSNTACIQGDALAINDKTVYYLESPFTQATVLQTINIAPGASVTTDTNPSFVISVQDADKSVATLRITTPDGQSQQSSVANGNVYPITLFNPTSSSYGVRVAISPNAGTVTLSILKSSQGNSSFEAGPIWDVSGRRVAFIETNSAGQRWLTLVNKNLGNADQNNQGLGGIDAHELLPIAGPVTSISFISDTTITVVGQNQVFTQSIPAAGKIPTDTPYSISAAMPAQVIMFTAGAPITVPVIGWKCQ